MKAHALRRSLAFLNVLLVLGALGGGAWYVMKVRPAQADDPKRGAWVKAASDAYQVAWRNATPAVAYPVSEKDLEAIVRPDLTDTKKGAPGVWPFVGPPPPPPKPPQAPVKPVEKPTGLEALGKLIGMIIEDPGARNTMMFEFFGSKRRRAFGPGDRIEDKEVKAPPAGSRPTEAPKARAPGLYLVSIQEAEAAGGGPQFRIVYEVVSEEGAAGQRQEVLLGLKQEAGKGPDILQGGGAAPTEGAPGTGRTTVAGGAPAAGPALPPNTPPPLEQVSIEVQRVSEDSREIRFDEAAWKYVRYSDPDQLLGDVKTEDARDAKGDPKGVRLTSAPPGSLASKFDVRPGDILKSINGKPVRSRAEAIEVVKGLPKDIASVAVVIERDGRDILYNVDPRDPRTRSAAGKVRYQGK